MDAKAAAREAALAPYRADDSTDLGDFTPTSGEAEETAESILTFGWFGERIRVNQASAGLELVDFIEEYGGMDEDDPRALVAVKTFMRSIIHPVSFDTFWQLAKAHNIDFAGLQNVLERVVSLQAERPTQRRSDSRPTRKNTKRRSRRATPSDAEYDKTIQELDDAGRPDLALHYVLAQERTAAAQN